MLTYRVGLSSNYPETEFEEEVSRRAIGTGLLNDTCEYVGSTDSVRLI